MGPVKISPWQPPPVKAKITRDNRSGMVRTGPPTASLLDTARWLPTLSVMEVTTRDFTRSFPRYRRAALAGKEVQVRDRDGNSFVFRAAQTDAPPSLAEAMGELIGSAASGRPRKTLAGYGRD